MSTKVCWWCRSKGRRGLGGRTRGENAGRAKKSSRSEAAHSADVTLLRPSETSSLAGAPLAETTCAIVAAAEIRHWKGTTMREVDSPPASSEYTHEFLPLRPRHLPRSINRNLTRPSSACQDRTCLLERAILSGRGCSRETDNQGASASGFEPTGASDQAVPTRTG